MVELPFGQEDFKFLKKFPVLPRCILALSLIIIGFLIQLILPIGGLSPYETTSLSPIQFFLGYALLLFGVFLIIQERKEISEKPDFTQEAGIWQDCSMKELSDYFNLLNMRLKENKKRTAYFDISQRKGLWLFIFSLLGITGIYLLILLLANRLYFSTAIFLLDLYTIYIPLWLIIKVELWDPDIIRKILYFYQLQQKESNIPESYIMDPAVYLQSYKDKEGTKNYLPLNVRFEIVFENTPEAFDSLAIHILINNYMGNKFPAMVCFLRFKKPSDWSPLKKDKALTDEFIQVKHTLEEEGLHLFVLSKSKKATHPYHTDVKQGEKMLSRAWKMIQDFS
jgi:hypothetical protein